MKPKTLDAILLVIFLVVLWTAFIWAGVHLDPMFLR